MTSQPPLPIYEEDRSVKAINGPKLKSETMKLEMVSLQKRMHSPQMHNVDLSAT